MPRPTSKKIYRLSVGSITLVSSGLFVTSLFFPVFYTLGVGQAADGGPVNGLVVLIFGWIPILACQPAWLANPACVAPLIILWFRSHKWGVLFGGTSMLLAASSVFTKTIPAPLGDYPITGYGPGFYLWLSAIAVPLAASVFFLVLEFVRMITEKHATDKQL